MSVAEGAPLHLPASNLINLHLPTAAEADIEKLGKSTGATRCYIWVNVIRFILNSECRCMLVNFQIIYRCDQGNQESELYEVMFVPLANGMRLFTFDTL